MQFNLLRQGAKTPFLAFKAAWKKIPKRDIFFDADRFSDGSAWGAAVFVSFRMWRRATNWLKMISGDEAAIARRRAAALLW
jgi:hypothetical protein